MTTIYKLLHPDLTSHGGYQWVLDEWRHTRGEGALCGPGWLHAYTHPLLASLLNPIHANIPHPVLYRGEAEGPQRDDYGLKVGYTSMRIVERLPMPTLTTEQRVRFGLACAVAVCHESSFRLWASRWITGEDRSAEAAEATAAAGAAWAAVAVAAAAAAAAKEAAAEVAVRAAWTAWGARKVDPVAHAFDLIACAEWAVSDSTVLV